jgi:hypothetical protein
MPRQIQYEGRVIEVPDDFSDDEVAQTLVSSAAPTDPNNPPGQVPVVSEPRQTVPKQDKDISLGGSYMQTMSGLNEGLGNLAAAVPEAVYRGQRDVRNFFGADLPYDSPVEAVKQSYNKTFTAPEGPSNRLERGLRRGGQQVGESLPLTMAPFLFGTPSAGAAVTQAAPSVWNSIKGAGQSIVDYAAKRPKSFVAADMEGNLASGVGAQVGKEMGGDGAAETAGALAGGMAPSAKILSAFSWGPKLAGAALSRGAEYIPNIGGEKAPAWLRDIQTRGEATRRDKAIGKVGGEVRDVLNDPVASANMDEMRALKEAIPGFNPTLAQATDSGSLKNLEQSLGSEAKGAELRRLQGRKDASTGAINRFADEAAPAGRTEELPEVNSLDTGEKLRGLRDARQGEMNKQVKAMRGAIDPGNEHGVEDLLTQREETGRMLRQVQAGTTVQSAQEAKALRAQRDQIDAQIAEIEASGANGVGQRLKDYNKFYKEEYVPRFSQDISKDMGRTRADSAEFIKGEDIPTRMFGPNNITEARQFNLIHGEDPEARKLMTDYALDSIRREGGEAGVQKWLTKHSRMLDEMPWLKEAVSSRGALARETWDRAISSGRLQGNDLLDAGKMQAFMAENRKELASSLSPKHLADLDTVIKAAAMEARTSRPSGSVEVPRNIVSKTLNETAGTDVPQLLSRIFAVTSGRSSARIMGAEGGIRVLNKATNKQWNDAWRQALENPEAAETMAAAIRGGGATKMQKEKLYSFIAMSPVSDIEHRNDPEPPKPSGPFDKPRAPRERREFTPRQR